MLLSITHVGPKPPRSGDKACYETLTSLYLQRIAPWHATQTQAFPTEEALLAWLSGPKTARTPILPVLLDSRGRALTSAEFAAWLGARRDQGSQHIAFAIGPASGWSQVALDHARAHAGLQLSFGAITLAHDLARLVLAEQLYRACTILAGHPYHTGH